MLPRKVETVEPEIKVTVELLLSSEDRLNKLQDVLYATTASQPKLQLQPPGFASAQGQDGNKVVLQQQINDIRKTTLDIVDKIEKSTSGPLRERVVRLKEQWVKDNEDLKKGEDWDLTKKQKEVKKIQNKDWDIAEKYEVPKTDLKQNIIDVTTHKATYLDKIRGLDERYSRIDKDTDSPKIIPDPSLSGGGGGVAPPSEPDIEPEPEP